MSSSKAPKPNNRKYSENWIMLCVLQNIIFTVGYSIRNINKITKFVKLGNNFYYDFRAKTTIKQSYI